MRSAERVTCGPDEVVIIKKRPRFEQNEKTRLHFKLETSLFSVEILEPCLITATD
jgi:hypothetical protein